MAIEFDLVDPLELTGFVRELQFPNVNALARWLPDRDVNDLRWAFNKADVKSRPMAQFRAFNVPSPFGDRPGFDRLSGPIPPISKAMMVTEWETLQIAQANGDPRFRELFAQQAFDDARVLTEDIRSRVEWARSQVLRLGKVQFTTDLGYVGIEVDYAQTAAGGAMTAVTAATAWTDLVNSTPITNLRAWTRAYITRNRGARPEAFVTSQDAIDNLSLNAEVRNLLASATNPAFVPPIVTAGAISQLLSVQGLPPIVAIDEQINVAGTDTRVIPVNIGLLLPPPDRTRFGETQYGPTAESLELVTGGRQQVATAPGLTGVVFGQDMPVMKFTNVSALAAPVCKNIDLITVATLW